MSRWEETPRDTLEGPHFPTILEILGEIQSGRYSVSERDL